MTGRTHDLAAFTALSVIVATQDMPQMSLATAFVAFSANMVGGLAPDIDQSTGALWKKIRLGRFMGKILAPVFGGHRHISHSLLGIFLFGIIASFLLRLTSTVLLVDMQIIWYSFMIGVISHIVADSFTRGGVPWLLPIPVKLGIPPIKALRFKTKGFVEKGIVFPGLILFNMWIFYAYHERIIDFLRSNIK